jgi:hypothetical protein
MTGLSPDAQTEPAVLPYLSRDNGGGHFAAPLPSRHVLDGYATKRRILDIPGEKGW